MSLDSFVGGSKKKSKKTTKSKKKPKKSSKKTSKKDSGSLKDLSSEIEKQIQESKTEIKDPYKLIKINLSCTAKCGYAKTIKRTRSYKPKEKDLICPKCGKTMKIKKGR